MRRAGRLRDPVLNVLVVLVSLTLVDATAGEILGQARVLDGDSLRIGEIDIRLHGIDAPEYRQVCTIAGRPWQCGHSARQALAGMLGHAPVRCEWDERDAYGRLLATCYLDGINVNARLVRQGMALAYTRYSERYLGEQERARAAGEGLWRSSFMPPWQWRQENPRREHGQSRSPVR